MIHTNARLVENSKRKLSIWTTELINFFFSQQRYPVDCSGFHEGEAKVTKEYVHSEL